MELNHLKYFFEVARHGSFTKASRALKVSQPSISKIVKQIEDRQGVKLFDRGKRSVELTEVGKVFYASCQTIFREVDNLRHGLRDLEDGCGGELAIGASDNLCNHALPALLAQFSRKYPNVRFQLFSGVSEAIAGEVLEGRVELGLFYTPVREPRLELDKLGAVPFVAVCAPGLLSRQRPSAKALHAASFIGSRGADYRGPYPVLRMLDSLGIKPKTIVETNNQETQKQLALEGHGFTVLPRFMVQRELHEKRLVAIETPRPIGAELFVATLKNRSLSKTASVFRAVLKERLPVLLSRDRRNDSAS